MTSGSDPSSQAYSHSPHIQFLKGESHPMDTTQGCKVRGGGNAQRTGADPDPQDEGRSPSSLGLLAFPPFPGSFPSLHLFSHFPFSCLVFTLTHRDQEGGTSLYLSEPSLGQWLEAGGLGQNYGDRVATSPAKDLGCEPLPPRRWARTPTFSQLAQVLIHLSTARLTPGCSGSFSAPPLPLLPGEGHGSPHTTHSWPLRLALWTRPGTDTRQKEGDMTHSDPGPIAGLPRLRRRPLASRAAQGKRNCNSRATDPHAGTPRKFGNAVPALVRPRRPALPNSRRPRPRPLGLPGCCRRCVPGLRALRVRPAPPAPAWVVPAPAGVGLGSALRPAGWPRGAGPRGTARGLCGPPRGRAPPTTPRTS